MNNNKIKLWKTKIKWWKLKQIEETSQTWFGQHKTQRKRNEKTYLFDATKALITN